MKIRGYKTCQTIFLTHRMTVPIHCAITSNIAKNAREAFRPLKFPASIHSASYMLVKHKRRFKSCVVLKKHKHKTRYGDMSVVPWMKISLHTGSFLRLNIGRIRLYLDLVSSGQNFRSGK